MIIVARTEQEKHAARVFMGRKGKMPAVSSDFKAFICVDKIGNIIAVIAYDDFIGRTCRLQVEGNGNWVSRDLMVASAYYPFVELDLVAMFANASADSAQSMELLERVGFEEIYRIPDGIRPGVDMVGYRMDRANCRWLKENRLAA